MTANPQQLAAPSRRESREPNRAAVRPKTSDLPRPSERWLRWFTAYTRWYVARHFHAVRLLGVAPAPPPPEIPLVVYLNHPSWWDPLLCLLARAAFFAERRSFAPIEAAMLARYRFFARLGFFGIEPDSARGAARFLRVAGTILRTPNAALWLTPQGRFCDARQRPAGFKPGLGHLAARLERAVFLPLALEITYWEERTPEALLHFGRPVEVSRQTPRLPAAWTACLEAALVQAQEALASAALRRDPAEFQVLLRGAAGVGGGYDLWRRLRAAWRGETFTPEHGRK
jgi:1-acyl-sn-glycerol-3-phosphate acyltransferase